MSPPPVYLFTIDERLLRTTRDTLARLHLHNDGTLAVLGACEARLRALEADPHRELFDEETRLNTFATMLPIPNRATLDALRLALQLVRAEIISPSFIHPERGPREPEPKREWTRHRRASLDALIDSLEEELGADPVASLADLARGPVMLPRRVKAKAL